MQGARIGKEEGIQGLERTATANVGKLEGPDFMGFHGTVTENAGVFECVLRGWEPSLRGNWVRKMEPWNLLMLWTLSLTREQFREPGCLAGMVAEEGGSQKKDRCTYSSGTNTNLPLKILRELARPLCLHLEVNGNLLRQQNSTNDRPGGVERCTFLGRLLGKRKEKGFQIFTLWAKR